MSDNLRKQARGAFLQGKYSIADALYTSFLESGGDEVGAFLHLGICREIAGDKVAAKKYYSEYGSREGGSDALRENIRGRAFLHLSYPVTPTVHIDIDPKETVTMSRLIGWGRFGNQLLEYFWLHLHAMNHGLKLAVPYWLGRDLFGLADPILTSPQNFVEKPETELAMEKAVAPDGPSFAGLNIKGFCQINTQHTAPYKSVFRALFRPIDEIETPLIKFLGEVKGDTRSLIAIHIRRTDYVGSEFDIGEIEWYQSWLRSLNAHQKYIQVYVASDDPSVVNEFTEFGAVSNRDFDFSIAGAEFLPDWWVLAHADKVAISNSTFSLTATMFNAGINSNKDTVRPSESERALVAFNPWNTDVLHSKEG